MPCSGYGEQKVKTANASRFHMRRDTEINDTLYHPFSVFCVYLEGKCEDLHYSAGYNELFTGDYLQVDGLYLL